MNSTEVQTLDTTYTNLQPKLKGLSRGEFGAVVAELPGLFKVRGSVLSAGSSAAAAKELLICAGNVAANHGKTKRPYSLTESCQVGLFISYFHNSKTSFLILVNKNAF